MFSGLPLVLAEPASQIAPLAVAPSAPSTPAAEPANLQQRPDLLASAAFNVPAGDDGATSASIRTITAVSTVGSECGMQQRQRKHSDGPSALVSKLINVFAPGRTPTSNNSPQATEDDSDDQRSHDDADTHCGSDATGDSGNADSSGDSSGDDGTVSDEDISESGDDDDDEHDDDDDGSIERSSSEERQEEGSDGDDSSLVSGNDDSKPAVPTSKSTSGMPAPDGPDLPSPAPAESEPFPQARGATYNRLGHVLHLSASAHAACSGKWTAPHKVDRLCGEGIVTVCADVHSGSSMGAISDAGDGFVWRRDAGRRTHCTRSIAATTTSAHGNLDLESEQSNRFDDARNDGGSCWSSVTLPATPVDNARYAGDDDAGDDTSPGISSFRFVPSSLSAATSGPLSEAYVLSVSGSLYSWGRLDSPPSSTPLIQRHQDAPKNAAPSSTPASSNAYMNTTTSAARRRGDSSSFPLVRSAATSANAFTRRTAQLDASGSRSLPSPSQSEGRPVEWQKPPTPPTLHRFILAPGLRVLQLSTGSAHVLALTNHASLPVWTWGSDDGYRLGISRVASGGVRSSTANGGDGAYASSKHNGRYVHRAATPIPSLRIGYQRVPIAVAAANASSRHQAVGRDESNIEDLVNVGPATQPLSAVLSICAGAWHSCAIIQYPRKRSSSSIITSVVSWGTGIQGQLGQGAGVHTSPLPALITLPPSLSAATSTAGLPGSNVAVTATLTTTSRPAAELRSTVVPLTPSWSASAFTLAFGSNHQNHQPSDAHSNEDTGSQSRARIVSRVPASASSQQLPPPASSTTPTPNQLSCSDTHTLILMSNGDVIGFGDNSMGCLGLGGDGAGTQQEVGLAQMGSNSSGQTERIAPQYRKKLAAPPYVFTPTLLPRLNNVLVPIRAPDTGNGGSASSGADVPQSIGRGRSIHVCAGHHVSYVCCAAYAGPSSAELPHNVLEAADRERDRLERERQDMRRAAMAIRTQQSIAEQLLKARQLQQAIGLQDEKGLQKLEAARLHAARYLPPRPQPCSLCVYSCAVNGDASAAIAQSPGAAAASSGASGKVTHGCTGFIADRYAPTVCVDCGHLKMRHNIGALAGDSSSD